MAPTHQADWSPNDWPESLEEMRTIDNLLRCSICYEFFKTAVLVQECSHNYCSLCIRQALVYDTQCPTCFVKASGNDLKCNRVLDELVKNFVNVRPKLLDLINKAPVQTAPVKSENELSDDSASNFVITPRRKKIHPKTKIKKGKSPCPTPRNKRKRQKLVDSDSDDIDCENVNVVAVKQEPQAMEVDPEKSPVNNPSVSESKDCTINSFVECPVCEELVSGNTINSHLDVCLTTGEKKSSLRSHKKASDTKPKSELASKVNTSISSCSASSFMKSPSRLASSSHNKTTSKKVSVAGSNAFISAGPKRKAIPGLVYAILSDKQLKQKLKEWNLSTQGDRQTLIKRHQEFVIAYNAQCDSLHPKSASSIVKELEIREKRRNANSTSTNPNLHLNKDASEEEVDKAHKQYLQQNQGQFEKLINDIRKRKKPVTTSMDDKPTKSVTIIDKLDSKLDDKTELSTDQPLVHCKEVKENVSLDDDSIKEVPIGTMPTNVSELAGTLNAPTSKKQSIPCESSTSVVCAHRETEDGGRQNSNFPLEENYRQDEECSGHLDGSDSNGNVEEEQQVPEPPSISNLASINDGDPINDNSSDDSGDDDNDDDDDDDDDKNDEDWELMTPSFGLASSDEEFNEDEDGESDEDLFASKPSTVAKLRSSRKKKQ